MRKDTCNGTRLFFSSTLEDIKDRNPLRLEEHNFSPEVILQAFLHDEGSIVEEYPSG